MLAPEKRESRLRRLKVALCGYTGPHSQRRKYDVTAVRESDADATIRVECGDNNIISVVIHLKP
jgi:hypothetical protein